MKGIKPVKQGFNYFIEKKELVLGVGTFLIAFPVILLSIFSVSDNIIITILSVFVIGLCFCVILLREYVINFVFVIACAIFLAVWSFNTFIYFLLPNSLLIIPVFIGEILLFYGFSLEKDNFWLWFFNILLASGFYITSLIYIDYIFFILGILLGVITFFCVLKWNQKRKSQDEEENLFIVFVFFLVIVSGFIAFVNLSSFGFGFLLVGIPLMYDFDFCLKIRDIYLFNNSE